MPKPVLNTLPAALALFAVTTLAAADTVELVTGDLLHGTVVQQTDQAVVLDHPLLGRIELPADQIKTITLTPATDPPGQTPVSPATPAQPTMPAPALAIDEPAVDSKILPDRILPGWDKHFELGFNGSDGNSQTFNLNSRFTATREDNLNRWKLDARYFRNQDDGSRTRNEFSSELVRDWLMPDSPWFTFANGKLEYDEFQDWETRTSGFLGVGKVIVDSPVHKLTGRVGLGGSYEFGEVNELVPEALLGLAWVFQINDQQKLQSHVTLFPDLNESGESRITADVAWIIKLDHTDGLSLKFGIDDEYESRTEGTAKHNDIKYYGALVFDF